jgi:hypothetical protein
MAFWRKTPAVFLSIALALAGCDGGSGDDRDSGSGDGGPPIVRCGPLDDPDGDYLSTADEGSSDPDGDGIANSMDDDSDGDGFPDADEAGDQDCFSDPEDTDGDGSPDFLDTDANGDGIPDNEQIGDLDADGIPDSRDPDIDGDGINNRAEFGDGATARDSDGDGTPDVIDLDSDGDTITDAHEGLFDFDMDGLENFRDLDSDDDGIQDTVEAGDGLIDTPPRSCENEINPVTGLVGSDGRADFNDFDSDNDGVGDSEENEFGTDTCNINTDDDAFDDLAEIAYERLNCIDGDEEACGCASTSVCEIPDEHFYVVLPYGDVPITRDLDFGTTIRVADVFFISDTTGSMGGTISNVRTTIATPDTGLIDRIRETIPDAWFGAGQYDDLPFSGWGFPPDEPFILAIRMTEDADAVQTAVNGIVTHNGSDGPESGTQALWSIVDGSGGTMMFGGGAYTMPDYEGMCLDGGWGAPCFRDAALPIVVFFTDICQHNGPPDDDAGCDPYAGVVPEPALWVDTVAEMNRRGVKFIGVNANGFNDCDASVGPDGYSPCHFLRRTAEETGSVDLDGNAMVFDLPNSGTATSTFADTIVGAVETVATRVPLDLDTGIRGDAAEPTVDTARFIKRRQPGCRAFPDPTPTCWVPPEGLAHEDAVAFVDESTFFGVIPGTVVTFRITFQNDFVPGDTSSQVFVAFINVRTGTAVLDTRQVIIVVPADPDGPIG